MNQRRLEKIIETNLENYEPPTCAHCKETPTYFSGVDTYYCEKHAWDYAKDVASAQYKTHKEWAEIQRAEYLMEKDRGND